MPLYAGLFWKRAACFRILVFRFTGVTGGAKLGGYLTLRLGDACPLPPTSKDAGMEGWWLLLSSESTSSSRRSAALSACSARARKASSTISP